MRKTNLIISSLAFITLTACTETKQTETNQSEKTEMEKAEFFVTYLAMGIHLSNYAIHQSYFIVFCINKTQKSLIS